MVKREIIRLLNSVYAEELTFEEWYSIYKAVRSIVFKR